MLMLSGASETLGQHSGHLPIIAFFYHRYSASICRHSYFVIFPPGSFSSMLLSPGTAVSTVQTFLSFLSTVVKLGCYQADA